MGEGGYVYAKLDVNDNTDLYVKKNGTIFKVKTVDRHKMFELFPDTYRTMTSVPNDRDWYSYTEQFTDLNTMFHNCSQLITIPTLNTSNVTNFSYMFVNCYHLESIPKLDTSKAIKLTNLFVDCKKLTKIPQLDTSKAIDTSGMFWGCSSLTSIPQLDTSNTIDVSMMFFGCSCLISVPVLDIRSMKSNNNMFNMLKNSNITHITFKNKQPHLQITPELLGKSDVTIHYI